jgi:hypothetical protein
MSTPELPKAEITRVWSPTGETIFETPIAFSDPAVAAAFALYLGISGGVVPIPVFAGKTLVVDSAHGDDETAIRGRFDLPYATISGAESAASANDTIHVRSGFYNETGLGVTDVHYQFDPGVVVNYTGPSTVPVFSFFEGTTRIRGSAILRNSNTGSGGAVLSVSGGTIDVECSAFDMAGGAIVPRPSRRLAARCACAAGR